MQDFPRHPSAGSLDGNSCGLHGCWRIFFCVCACARVGLHLLCVGLGNIMIYRCCRDKSMR